MSSTGSDYSRFRIEAEKAGFAPILEGMNPVLMEALVSIHAKLELRGWQPVIAEAFRTEAMQAEKFARRFSLTMTGSHIRGDAVDLVDARYHWKRLKFTKEIDAYCADLKEILKQYPQLRWGGYFEGYGPDGDWAHIEINPEWDGNPEANIIASEN